MKNNLNIVFFGTPKFAMPVLDSLMRNGYNVSHFQKKYLKDEAVFEEFKSLKPDICIVAAYGKILPKRYLDVPKFGFLNIHPSLLPKYRGPSPIQTAIINGDEETGVSIMVIDSEIDHGPILNSIKYQVVSSKYFTEMAKELFELGAKLLIEVLPKYINGEINPVEQDHNQATFTKILTRQDGRIDWSKPAEQIYNQIRALNPEPGTWTLWKGKVINIPTCPDSIEDPRWLCHRDEVGYPQLADLMPGAVKKIGNDIVIGTEMGYLIIKSIQLEGGKKMDAKSFINGHPDFLNSVLE